MSRRCFEQMLDELDLVNFSSYHRWYASRNPACYSMPDMHQDYRNSGRPNHFDLYTIDYRQPYWMPQNLLFPSYEPFCFLRRNDRRKNYHFSREKRNNGEKRFFPNRHEDIPFRVDRGKNADFLSQFDRRYLPAWNRDASAHHYQLSRDDRNSSRLSFKNSNIDLCTEDMVDQHLQNFKQVFESRNPSSDGLAVNGSVSQNGLNENSMHTGSNLTLNYSKASEMEWNNLGTNNRFPDGAQYKDSDNFSNSYESWYCPEEQQQIIDTLKEVNLRHDRQLKRDMLLAKEEQHLSDESMSPSNYSQNSESLHKSQSSEDDDDFINILLSPGAAPQIPETTNEEDAKEINSGYLEKSATDFFEEFQNIFSGSPERKTINNMTKESLKTPYVIDEESVDVGRNITEGDKNAVKTVLNFDENVEDISEKPFENSSNIISSSPKEHSDNALSPSNKLSLSGISSRDHPDINEENCENALSTETTFKSQPPNIDYNPNMSTREMHVKEKDTSLSFYSKQTSSNENLDTKFNYISLSERSRKNVVDSKLKRTDKAVDKTSIKNMGNWNDILNNSKENYSSTEIKRLATECQSSRQGPCSKFPLDKNYVRYWRQQAIAKEIKKHSYSLNQLHFGNRIVDDKSFGNVDALHNKSQGCNRNPCTIRISSKLSSICSSQSGRESLTNTFLVNKDSQHTETFDEKLGSLSEPILTQEKNEVVYKRISLSEIFSYANAESEKRARDLSSNQRSLEDLIHPTENVYHLSPSEHLKQILGIGQDVTSEENKIKNNSFRRGMTNKKHQSQCAFTKTSDSAIQNPCILSTAEDCCKAYKECETSFPQKHTCCTTVMNTPVKNEQPESNVAHPKSPSKAKMRESGTSFHKKGEDVAREYLEEKFSSSARISRNLNSSFAECAKGTDKRKHGCCLSSSNYDTESKPNNVSKNSAILSSHLSNKCFYDPRVRNGESDRTHPESEYKTKNMDTYSKSKKNRRHDSFQRFCRCDSSESSFKNDENMNSTNPVCKTASSNSNEFTVGLCLQTVEVEQEVFNSKSNLGSPKGKRKFKKRNRKEKSALETNETRRNWQDNCVSNAKCNVLQNNQSKRISPVRNKQDLSGKSRNAMSYKYDKNLSANSSLAMNERHCVSNNKNEDAFIRNNEVKDCKISEKILNQKFRSKALENQEKCRGGIKKEEMVTNFRGKSSNLEMKHTGLKEYESKEIIKRWNSSFKQYTSKVGGELKTPRYDLCSGPESKILKNKILQLDVPLTVVSEISCLPYKARLPTSESVAGENKRVMKNGKFKGCLNKINYETEIPLSSKEVCNLKMKNWPSNLQISFNTIQYLRPNTFDLIFENESRGVRRGVSLPHFKFLNSFPVISPSIEVMSRFKYKTQRMLEEAEKIASLVEKRTSNLSLEEIRLKRSKRRKCIDCNLLSNANNGCATKFSTCSNFSYKQSLLDKFFKGDKVSNTSSERTVMYTFKRIHDIDCPEFLKKLSDFVSYKKGSKHREGYIVHYTKEFQRNDNTQNCVPALNELRRVKSKNHFNNPRSNQEFQLSPLTDVFFEIHVRDIISQFDSMKLSENLRKSLHLCLNTEVEESIFQALPLLLRFLIVLSTLRVPCSRKHLKELIYFRPHEKKKLGDVKILVPRMLLRDNNDCDILKCWDILTSHFV